VDEIQSINNLVLTGRSKDAALRKAKKDADTIVTLYDSILRELPLEVQDKVRMIRRNDICDTTYNTNAKIIYDEYLTNPIFKEFIL
jgi:hypothetical protein